MSKSIKLENKVYYKLEEIREKRETFSQAVEKLLDLRIMLLTIDPILRGQKSYQEFKDAQEREKQAAER